MVTSAENSHEELPKKLPVWEKKKEILDALRVDSDASGENSLIIQASTGSGKSTQIPQMLLDAGVAGTDGEIWVLQPRRLPARMLARRVASERNGQVGQEVGYQIRLDNCTSPKTRIRYVTEGVLMRRLLGDPALTNIPVIIFDEFHERHLDGDIGLARCRQLQQTIRPDLKLIVMSATLEIKGLEQYLSPCKIITSENRQFPVEVHYQKRAVSDKTPVWELAAEIANDVICQDPKGKDILIFMPGSYEIHRTLRALEDWSATRSCLLLPLYGELRPEDQDMAVQEAKTRKIIVSTNVAETSLTIPGITTVIDSGLARVLRFDPNRGINSLLVEKISQASAEQRAGRAGRTAPGKCFRLWTEQEHALRPATLTAEILRLELSEVILHLKASGITDIASFPWIEAPSPHALEEAMTLLTDLGALHAQTGELTPVGRELLRFPVHPRYARMFVEARKRHCLSAATLAAALVQGRSILIRTQDRNIRTNREDILGEDPTNDFTQLLHAFMYAKNSKFNPRRCQALGIHAGIAREVAQLHQQFLELAKVSEEPAADPEPDGLIRSILAGFPDHVAVRLDQGTLRCALTRNRRGVLTRDSHVTDAPHLVVAEIREIENADGVQTLLSLACAIQIEWLKELYPEDFHISRQVRIDPLQKRVVANETVCFRDLILETGKALPPTPDEAASLLAQEAISDKEQIHDWNETAQQFIFRVNALSKWMPEFEIQPIEENDLEFLISQACLGATTLKDLSRIRIFPQLQSWLQKPQLQALEKFAPARITLPNKKSVKVDYSTDTPTIQARIQELYDITDEILIANRQIPLRIEILAPNFRPVQITQNLKDFWTNQYPTLKKELQRRYPKHLWK